MKLQWILFFKELWTCE